jgi:uncharacterized membrane protein YhhN
VATIVFIVPPLPSELHLPVSVYSAVIGAVGVSASSGTNHARVQGVAGVFIFAISDVLIAVNKFHFPVWEAHGLVNGLYYTGQLLIVDSIISHRFFRTTLSPSRARDD